MCPQSSKIVRLAEYTDSGYFHSREEAFAIIESEELHRHVWAEIDFEGIVDASADFIDELFPVQPDRELPIWLSPRNYGGNIHTKLAKYFCQLETQRELWSRRAFDHSWFLPPPEDARAC